VFSPLVAPFYPGGLSFTVDWSDLRELKSKTHFEEADISALLDKFSTLAVTSDGIAVIDRATFKSALGVYGEYWGVLQDRMFSLFDPLRHDMIYFPNFVQVLSILQRGTVQEKASLAFRGYDLNDDDVVSRSEFVTLYAAYIRISFLLSRENARITNLTLLEKNDLTTSHQPLSALFGQSVSVTSTTTTAQKPVELKQGPFQPIAFDDAMDTRSGTWHILQDIAHDAIQDMADQFFKEGDELTAQQWTELCVQEPTLMAWLDLFGLVF
jgi:Ca2+-binding EF-hand superfamily protein